MKFIFDFIRKLINIIRYDILSYHFYYKIIDEIDEHNFKIQCKNSKTLFDASIYEIVFTDILHNMDPVQACFIGARYSKVIKCKTEPMNFNFPNENRTENLANCFIKYQDRKGLICYFDFNTNKEHFCDPLTLASDDKLIANFSPEQAFYIGIFAGLKISAKKSNVICINKNISSDQKVK